MSVKNLISIHFVGREKVVELLLKNNANPNLKDNDDETPLFRAVAPGISTQL